MLIFSVDLLPGYHSAADFFLANHVPICLEREELLKMLIMVWIF